jgi:hypothetical protein
LSGMIKRRLELWGLACDTLLFRLSFFVSI